MTLFDFIFSAWTLNTWKLWTWDILSMGMSRMTHGSKKQYYRNEEAVSGFHWMKINSVCLMTQKLDANQIPQPWLIDSDNSLYLFLTPITWFISSLLIHRFLLSFIYSFFPQTFIFNHAPFAKIRRENAFQPLILKEHKILKGKNHYFSFLKAPVVE